jgi:hypothetical protein
MYAIDNNQNDIHDRDRNHKKGKGLLSVISFVTIFEIQIFIASFSFKQDFHIFVPWN